MIFRSPTVRIGFVAILGASVAWTSLFSLATATTAASVSLGHEASTSIPLRYAPNGPTPTSSTTLPTGPGVSYYLSLGDSVGMWDGTGSFPYLLANRYSHSSVPDLRLIDMSCSGETTESMVKGSTCARGRSQYDNAVSFVTAHRGHIALITISIGGNDVLPCMSQTNAGLCFENGLPKMKAHISMIVAGLRAAAGPHVPIVGMNLYDPLLGDWLAPGPGRSLTVAAVAGVGLLDRTMGQAYRAEADPVADIQGAFRSTDLTHFVRSAWGRVPVAVANACTLLDIDCHRGSIVGYGDDPNQAGAVVVARAFEKAIGRLRSPGPAT
jgi:GDSL-like Lipase/Acylhydrolase family